MSQDQITASGTAAALTPLQQWRIGRDKAALIEKIDADRRAAAAHCVALWAAREREGAQDHTQGRVLVRYAAAGGGTHLRPAQVLGTLPGDDRVTIKLLDSGSIVSVHASSLQTGRDDYEPRTLPAVYASELPECRGNCDQGRRACSHPAVCATAPDRSTDDDDDLPGPVTQSLTLEIIDRELAAERRTLGRLVKRAAALLVVLAAGTMLLGCGGGVADITATTQIDGPVVIDAGQTDTLVARVQLECPTDTCTILVEQDATWTWSEAGDQSARSVIGIGGLKPGIQTPPVFSGVLTDTTKQVSRIGRSTRLDATGGLVSVEYRVGHRSAASLAVSGITLTATVVQP